MALHISVQAPAFGSKDARREGPSITTQFFGAFLGAQENESFFQLKKLDPEKASAAYVVARAACVDAFEHGLNPDESVQVGLGRWAIETQETPGGIASGE